MRTLSTSALFVASAFVLAACVDPATQLTVVTASDLPAESRACVRIEARPLEVPDFTASNAIDRPEVPFSFGVAPPGGDAKRNVEIRVSAFPSCDAAEDPAARPVVSRRVRTGFVEGLSLRLDVFLASRCRDVVCPDEQTCAPETGMCEDIGFVDPASLSTVGPGDELRRDGGAGGRDAAVSVGSFERPASPSVVVEPVGATGGDEVRFGWDVATDASGDAFVATQTTSGAVQLEIQRVAPDGARRWRRTWSGNADARVLRRIRDALYLCIEIEDTLTPDGGTPIALPTGHGTRDASAIVLARVRPDDGSMVWTALIERGPPTSGTATRMDCGGIAEIPGGLAVAFGATPSTSPIAIGGVTPTPVGHAAPNDATGFLALLADDGARPSVTSLRAVAGVAALSTEFTPFWPRLQTAVAEDGEGGVLFTARGSSGLSGLLDGESVGGTSTSLGIARYDASGTSRWAQRLGLSASGGAALPRAVRSGTRVVVLGSASPGSGGGSTTLSGVSGLEAARATFSRPVLFALGLSLVSGTPDAASFRSSEHRGWITDAHVQPSGEIVIAGFGLGDRTAAMATPTDTFGASWSVADLDEGFVAALEPDTLAARWLLELETPALAEDSFSSTTEWERVTGADVGPGGETWITGKVRVRQDGNTVLGTPTGGLGYLVRLR
jgi:hypothetical protein